MVAAAQRMMCCFLDNGMVSCFWEKKKIVPEMKRNVHAGHVGFHNTIFPVRPMCVDISQTVSAQKGLIFKEELNFMDLQR